MRIEGCACTKPRYASFLLRSSRFAGTIPSGDGFLREYTDVFLRCFPPGSLSHSPGALLRGWTWAFILFNKPGVSLWVWNGLQDALNLHPFKPGASLRIASELQDALNLHPFKPSVSLRLWKDFQNALLIHPLKPGASLRIADDLQDALLMHLLTSQVHLYESGRTIRMH